MWYYFSMIRVYYHSMLKWDISVLSLADLLRLRNASIINYFHKTYIPGLAVALWAYNVV